MNPLKHFKTFVHDHVHWLIKQLYSGSYFNISNLNRFMETEEVPDNHLHLPTPSHSKTFKKRHLILWNLCTLSKTVTGETIFPKKNRNLLKRI